MTDNFFKMMAVAGNLLIFYTIFLGPAAEAQITFTLGIALFALAVGFFMGRSSRQ